MRRHIKHVLNFSSFVLTRLISIFAFALSVPFFIRHCSDAQYGVVAIGFSLLGWSAMFDVAIGYVITLSIGRMLARSGNTNQKLFQGMFSVYIYFASSMSVLILLILFFLKLSLLDRVYYGSLALLLPCLAVSGVVTAVFQAHNNLVYINASRFGFEICKALSLVISVLLSTNYAYVGPILLLGGSYAGNCRWICSQEIF